MLKQERRLMQWLERHLFIIFIVGAVAASLLLRFMLRGYNSTVDIDWYLAPWSEGLKAQGFLPFLQSHESNYHVLYLFLLWLSTFSPLTTLVNIKLISIVFDYIAAAAMAYAVWTILGADHKQRKGYAAAAFVATLFLPIVIFNGAMWGQCDIIYTAFLLLALAFYCKENYTLSFFFFAVSCAFKLQAVFYLPMLLVLYFTKRKFSVLQFLQAPLLLWVLGLFARAPGDSLFYGFSIYGAQTREIPRLTAHYANLYEVFNHFVYKDLAPAAMISALLVFFCFFCYIVLCRIDIPNDMLPFLIAWCVFTVCMFMPNMHERYGFMGEIFIWLYFFLRPSVKRFWLAFGMNFIPMCHYLRVFAGQTYFSLLTMSLIHIAVYLCVTAALFCTLRPLHGTLPKE